MKFVGVNKKDIIVIVHNGYPNAIQLDKINADIKKAGLDNKVLHLSDCTVNIIGEMEAPDYTSAEDIDLKIQQEAAKACADIFNDFDYEEVMRENVSIMNAWNVGREICNSSNMKEWRGKDE